MIPTIRLHSQQLINPVFNNPKDLVSWMGGIQAQDYTMSKWAIGIRLKAGNLQTVNEATKKDMKGLDAITHHLRSSWEVLRADQPLRVLYGLLHGKDKPDTEALSNAVTAVLDKGAEIIRLAEEERRKYENG